MLTNNTVIAVMDVMISYNIAAKFRIKLNLGLSNCPISHTY